MSKNEVFPNASPNPALPLAGLKVIDLSRLLPGPYATQMLGDMGADVLKVEDTQLGDYLRWEERTAGGENPAFLQLNRNKRSLTLNFKLEEGRQIFKKIVAEADVLLESFRPGVMARLGLGYDELKEINPGLIFCAISGYGQTGPYKDRPGHDLNYIGYAGLLGISGQAAGAPAIPGTQIADLAGGALMAVTGILAALHGRQTSGKGRFIDISMTAGVTGLLSLQSAFYLTGSEPIRRENWRLNGGLPEYNVYETADGKYLTVGALEPKFFGRLCELIGLPEYAQVQASPARQLEIKTALGKRFKEKTQAEWLQLLAAEDTCVGPVYDYEEIFTDPQAQAFGITLETEHPQVGKLRQLNLPFKLDGLEAEHIARTPAPAYSEHTNQILQALGYTEPQIAELKTAGVIR